MLLMLVVTTLLTIMSLAVLNTTDHALRLEDRQTRNSAAFNLAESGIDRAIFWIRNQPSPPSGTAPFDPFGGWQQLGEGTYIVSIDPDDANPGQYLKAYTITCRAIVHGEEERIEAKIRQASFGRYLYFTDSEVSSISGGAIWFKAGEIMDGPAHSNNTSGSVFNINYVGSTAPIFLDTLTGSGSYINYSPSAPTNETTYRRIFRDGSRGFRLGVDRIELPDSTNIQRDAAWGSSSGFPSTRGVYVRSNNNGGIYIRDNARIKMEVDSSNRQIIKVTQVDSGTGLDVVTTITIDRVANQTIVQRGSNPPTIQSGTGTGVIYCTGNITSLEGVIADNVVEGSEIVKRNAFTIACDVNNYKNITITNNLVYKTKPDRNQEYDAQCNLLAGTLGLVARRVIVDNNAPTDLSIDAVMLCGGRNTSDGSFYVNNYNTKTPTGVLHVLGGIIQKKRGPVGTFNPSTGQMSTGYAKDYRYDPRLMDNPPPYYPTTGTFERLSWRRLPY